MEELKKVMDTLADDVVEMSNDTLKMIPGATLLDCFPYTAYRNVTINGIDYRMKVEIELHKAWA